MISIINLHVFMLLLSIFFFEIRYFVVFNTMLTNFFDLFTLGRLYDYISIPPLLLIFVSFYINIKIYKKQ